MNVQSNSFPAINNRRAVLVAVLSMAALFTQLTILGQDDVMAPKDRQWYLNYTEALDLIKSGEFDRAALYLETAITQKPNPKKNTKFYGNIRRPYLPHFYLGKAYFNLGKFELAKASLQKSRQFAQAASLDEGPELDRLLGQVDVRIAELEEAAPTTGHQSRLRSRVGAVYGKEVRRGQTVAGEGQGRE